MENTLVATVDVAVDAPASVVWNALVDPALIKEYMFGTEVITNWKEGHPIIWKGEWEGKPYEDKGTILKFDSPRTLQYSHFSSSGGTPDTPENNHTVTIKLTGTGDKTLLTLTQDNNKSEAAAEDSKKNWKMMLEGLKKEVEK